MEINNSAWFAQRFFIKNSVESFKTKKPVTHYGFFGVDPTGLAPAFSLVKGEILLHKLQAQGPQNKGKTKEDLYARTSFV
ncbi:MAG: hypothetical protein A3I24_01590 [Candidatus Harrisonbacteria bacterium RIFCSPLOWO2_02_FULL_41_13b]|uniref:Uncharacterized protein n=1 Tax=Candidatus Harrisonbacteria bacterium RIFCSPLOWO2_02_FULL_41_13b TaxID=1798409 RepID=A0A1G1ZRF3_9BACT|nr:MAG: hypothetical protein A3I24_01590 [Candidatus Harrisonbacteria bacterium RIFCSPLOWO2_02_FULL_41_13b]